MYLVFDTETSNLPLWKESFNDIRQPVILQLGCVLLDQDYEEVASYYSLVKPSRPYNISDGAFNAHGITKQRVDEYGVEQDYVLDIFNSLYAKSDIRVAHNLKFDGHLINCSCSESYDFIDDEHNCCTMLESTPICKLTGKFKGQYKWPKLQEVYTFAFGSPFDKAHDAMADVRATAKVFKWLSERRNVQVPLVTAV